MERKTIGTFIAVLRKAAGLTQQELADRLNVSNKAVSRWERDECAPDISLIPVIAEIFDVTCDELLKGGRILAEPPAEKPAPKIDKQIKRLLGNSLSRFKSSICISISVSLIGFVLLFAISYGFFRPAIGVAVVAVFAIVAAAITLVALNRLNEITRDNELLDYLPPEDMNRLVLTRYRWSFVSLMVCAAAILFALPLIPRQGYFLNIVITFETYARQAVDLFAIALVFFLCLDAIGKRLFLPETSIVRLPKQIIALNWLHFGILALTTVFVIVREVALNNERSRWDGTFPIVRGQFYTITSILQWVVLATWIFGLLAIVFVAVKERRNAVVTGVRNIAFFLIYSNIGAMATYYFRPHIPNLHHIRTYGTYMIISIIAVGMLTISGLLKKHWVQ
ncbi:MAG: helix-turn-helix domain-containing protein [Oscillospiraceae bacterium]|nr:helix-turn-helix domain-containing protein [Oscillospiraceae bacterium]